jgi:hypothetical protein
MKPRLSRMLRAVMSFCLSLAKVCISDTYSTTYGASVSQMKDLGMLLSLLGTEVGLGRLPRYFLLLI